MPLPVLRAGVLIGSLLLLAVPSAGGEVLTGMVVGVADGDTITLLDERLRQHKVRLAGIDAPEKGQPFGERSKQNLAALAFARRATVDTTKTDRYGRLVGKVMVGSTDVNIRKIEAGFAWFYKAYERELLPADRVTYSGAENAAKSLARGLWSHPRPTPPWEFRRSRATGTGKRLAETATTVLE